MEHTPKTAEELSFEAAQAAYLTSGGVRCPVCSADQLEGESVETGNGIAWQKITCLSCLSMWVDNYKLVSIDELEVMT